MIPFDRPFMSPMERDMRQHQMVRAEMRELDDFKKCITQVVENYIKMLDTKVSVQDLQVSKAEAYMRDRIEQVTIEVATKLLQDGKIPIEFTYDPTTESLYIGGVLIE